VQTAKKILKTFFQSCKCKKNEALSQLFIKKKEETYKYSNAVSIYSGWEVSTPVFYILYIKYKLWFSHTKCAPVLARPY